MPCGVFSFYTILRLPETEIEEIYKHFGVLIVSRDADKYRLADPGSDEGRIWDAFIEKLRRCGLKNFVLDDYYIKFYPGDC
jgi:hypothetical protein